MRRIPCLLLLLATVTGFAAAARPARAAWPHDPVNGGVPVCVASGGSSVLVSLADGEGGVFVAWQDTRNGALDVFAQHVSAYGVPLWTANGVAVCTAVNNQENVALALDGSGGLLLAWDDFRSGVSYDIYAQRLNAAGVPQWPANGVALCTAAATQYGPAMVSDGAGGAVVAWQDSRNGVDYDIYARRVLANGTPSWTADGVGVCVATGGQIGVRAVTDNAGGAILAWQDSRGGANSDVYAQRVNGSGAVAWAANGIVVCNATADQNEVAVCPDGASGALVSWTDMRSGGRDIYVQRVWYPGVTLWTTNGVPLCTAAGEQRYPDLEPDGTGGGIVAWADSRAGYNGPAAQRVNQTGATMWTANGVLLSTGSGLQQTSVRAAADGLGGLVVSWLDSRTGNSTDTYVQRLDAAGAVKWLAGGVGVGLNPQQDNEAVVCGDGAGGAIVVLNDYRNINTTFDDLFAARVDVFGVMGGEPAVASVKDVPNDQGGQVRVSWAASPLDVDPASYAVSSYLLFRSAPSSLVANALRAGRVTGSLAAFGGDEGAAAPLYAQPMGAQVYYWEYVGQQAAYHLSSYSMVTATTGDSIGGSNPVSVFMVQARNAGGTQWWSSGPDSGYSVDNLAPVAPAPFTGQYASGTASLHWNPNPEADLAGYELYRGTSAAFVPGPGNLVAALADTGYADPAGAPYVYKLLAVDAHGNRSPVATLTPGGTLDVPGGAAAVSFLGAPSPNPARGGTSFAFGLALGGAARLAIYDAQGRRVRQLLAGPLAAGEHRVAWDGRDEAGRVAAPGVYLARLEAPGFAATRRLAVTR